MNSRLQSEDMDYLFDAILSLQDKEECYSFFEDICTINEINALKQRLQVAKMLKEKKTYIDIANLTGASTATISRVNRALSYGNEGYDLVLDRLENKK
nr:YerC/YecD family TrpR-related protein [Hathewaya massiliensis]